MRKLFIAAIAAGLTVVLAIFSDVVVAQLTPVITCPHVAPWLRIAAPLTIVIAALPSIVRRVRTRQYPFVER